jgi:cystathionine gamma-lyase/cystathionine gamma-lyase/homocysteine desulfhydrase
MHPITRCLHTRTLSATGEPAVTPLYQSSAFEASSPYFYTRKANPNSAELEEVVRDLEGAQHAIAMSTGMATIRACLELVRPKETIVLNRLVYGCSFKLVQRFAAHFDAELKILDLTTDEGIAQIPAETRLVLLETPTNPFLKSSDIAKVAAAAKRGNPAAIVVVDNTWATPLYQRPLQLGADVSLHSATKYMSGHSDVMGGVLLTDRADLAERFGQERFYAGAVLDPFAAWLLRRSMQTIGVRLERQGHTAKEMVSFLEQLPQIEKVYYPHIDGQQLRGYAGILFVELRGDLVPRYPDLLAALSYFGSGTGMACVTSMVAQPYTGSHASMNDEEKAAMGLSRSLVRLCFGLEDPEDLRTDLRNALRSIDSTAPTADIRSARVASH